MSKAAVHQMARELVKVFAQRKITVNAIVPGFVKTPRQHSKPEQIVKNIVAKTAAGRFGESEEIADLCLAVINNAFINGALLNIDGGYGYI